MDKRLIAMTPQEKVTSAQVGEAWLSIFLAGYKSVTVEEVRAALEAAEAVR